MNTQQAAWHHEPDADETDWKEICDRNCIGADFADIAEEVTPLEVFLTCIASFGLLIVLGIALYISQQ